MTTKTDERRTIKIKSKTYFAIKKSGMMGETFDDVLQRIMKLHEIETKQSKMTKRDKQIASKLG